MKGRNHLSFVEKMIIHGYIKEFKEIDVYVSKVKFGKSIGIGYKRMNKIFCDDISSLSGEILEASETLHLDFITFLKIALRQFQKELKENAKEKSHKISAIC